MRRDTRAAFRARGKAMDDVVNAAVKAQRDVQDSAYRAVKAAKTVAEAARVRYTRDDLLNAVVVADHYGWVRVVRVNELTVTVEGDFGARRIPFERVTDFREATK